MGPQWGIFEVGGARSDASSRACASRMVMYEEKRAQDTTDALAAINPAAPTTSYRSAASIRCCK